MTIQEFVELNTFSTFMVQATARYFTVLTSVEDIDELLQSDIWKNNKRYILGEGSNYISHIHVKLWNIKEAAPMARKISSQYNLSALDIETANAQFETGSDIRNLITYAVSITLLIVAGFGIYNILNMFIYEKMNDIAILKATGFMGSDVKWMFISQALIIEHLLAQVETLPDNLGGFRDDV